MATFTIETLTQNVEQAMAKAIEAMKRDFSAVRTGKASPALVENLMVDYYGTPTRLRDIAGITTPEPRLLVIQPWDQTAIKSIEKAIRASELGISPSNDGRVIRLPIPELSEERRKDLVKMVRGRTENARIEVRSVRRDANDFAKKSQKSSLITEDDLNILTKDIQKSTDNFIQKIDTIMTEKEKELMEI
jgi:ribosome recycling factor